jgi:ribosomal-protein-alanine N-acetyltransferase
LTARTKPKPGFRTATRADVKELLAIERDVYDGAVPWTATHFTREIENNPEAVFIVAERNKQLVGFIGLRVWLMREELHITNFAVATSRQHQGIGRGLMAQALELAQNLNAKKLSLETPRDNLVAQGFYRKQGFEAIEIRMAYYDDGKDALTMEKQL